MTINKQAQLKQNITIIQHGTGICIRKQPFHFPYDVGKAWGWRKRFWKQVCYWFAPNLVCFWFVQEKSFFMLFYWLIYWNNVCFYCTKNICLKCANHEIKFACRVMFRFPTGIKWLISYMLLFPGIYYLLLQSVGWIWHHWNHSP